MATHYIDPIGGNDANDGKSFANRKKTFGSISGLAAGDSIRVIETRAPVSMGTIAWTDAARSLTLNSSLTLEIDPCTAAWTEATNVTCSANAARKYGATASRFVIASGFTTGKIGYRTLPYTVDASAYTSISFWLNIVTVGSLHGQALTLNLCSDTTGDVPVAALLVDMGAIANFVSGAWVPVFIDAGGALPSNINSISISTTVDPGSCTIQLNNLFACQNKAHADHISLQSCLGKNTSDEPEWYPINSINGTEVTLGAYTSVQATPGPAYKGTTESVTTYQLVPTFPIVMTSAGRALPSVNGTEALPITLSFGWDSTAMTTQSGITAWTGCGYLGSFWTVNNDWWNITGPAYFVCALDPWSLGSSAQFCNVDIEQCVGIQTTFTLGASGDFANVSVDALVWCDAAATGTVAGDGIPGKLYIRRVTGCMSSSATDAAIFINTGTSINRQNCDVQIDRVDNNMGNGVGASSGTVAYLRGCTLENNVNADVCTSAGNLVLDNCKLLSTNKVSVNPPTADFASCLASNISSSEDHQIWRTGFRAFTQTTTRQVASGVAWQVQPVSTTKVNSRRQAAIPLARVAVSDSGLVTVTCYVRRSNTGLTIGIRAKSGQVAGLSTTQEATTAAAADTWDQLTITFTPTAKGVVEIEGFFYGGTTYSGYFDTLAVSQA